MIDIFLQKDVSDLLKDKHVVFMGDSNIRSIYKDLLCLIKTSKYISDKVLRTKGEKTCFGDKLLFIGPKYNGRDYREERTGCYNKTKLSFYFLTRVYNDYVEKVLDDLCKDKQNLPNVLIINSLLWDMTRWGPNGVDFFKKNLVTLMQELKKRIPDCLVIWLTTPPIAISEIKGGFLVKEIEFLKYSLRFHVVEANHYARKVVADHGFDVVDSHYHLKLQIHRRSGDGMHWQIPANRYVTNLLLTHISLAWGVSLPHRFKSSLLEENNISSSEEECQIVPNEEETKLNSKVSSDEVTLSGNEKSTGKKIKREAQNFTTPVKSKKRKSSRKKTSLFQESYHTYLKNADLKQRHNRIRQWGKTAENFLSQPFEHPEISSNNPQDSRYFANCSRSVPFFNQCQDGPNFINSSMQMQLPSNPYQLQPKHIPLIPSRQNNFIPRPQSPCQNQQWVNPRYMPLSPNRYPNQGPNNMFHNSAPNICGPRAMYMQPVPNMKISPYRNFANRFICKTPQYSYPQPMPLDANNWVQSQPFIDFASTDTVPFGINF